MATDSPELSVIVVSYNTCELLSGCLASVFAQTPARAVEVVVVDNHSTDGSAEMVAADFPQVTLIRSETNEGFARAANRGVAVSGAPWIVLLNPDTEVHDHALERLVEFGRAHPHSGLTGGRTLRPDGSLDPGSCWGDITLWSLTCFALGLSTALAHSPRFDPESLGRWSRDSVETVDIVSGCLLAASRATWDRLGGFDERFFMYAEDADLALRARALGFRPAITPEATITHELGAASGSGAISRAMVLTGKTTLLTKHWSPARARLGVALLVAGVGLRGLGARLLGRASSPWPEVWRARETWTAGWPQPDAARAP